HTPSLPSHSLPHSDLPPFPTRRSSDLGPGHPGHAHHEPVAVLPAAPGCPQPVEHRLHDLLLRCWVAGQRSLRRRVQQIRLGRCVDRKSTRLNSSHVSTSYAVFTFKKEL